MNLSKLKGSCLGVILRNQWYVSLAVPKGVLLPRGFPRGELLSINAEGIRNLRFDALRVLSWVRLAEEGKVSP